MISKENIFIQGDCLELLRDIPAGSVDLSIIDLPYGVTKNPWDVAIPLDKLWPLILNVCKPSAAMIFFSQGMFTSDLMQSNRKLWRYNLVWYKRQPAGFLNARRQPLRVHEDLCVFYRRQPTYNPQKTIGPRKVSSAASKRGCKATANYGHHGLVDYDSTERFPVSILPFSKDVQHSSLHPTQKPEALLRYLIRTYSNPGDLVLDCCAGSGTTGVAAIQEGRRYLLIEKDPDFYRDASERISEVEKSLNR